jgi:hypothetical protein
VEFSDPTTAVITSLKGIISKALIRPSTVCPETTWRLRGKAALGDFEIELTAVKRIEK